MFERELDKEFEEKPMQEAVEADETPLIQNLAMVSSHPPGQAELQCDIQAVIHAPTGYVTKRTIVTGGVTAKRLADLLLGIATW